MKPKKQASAAPKGKKQKKKGQWKILPANSTPKQIVDAVMGEVVKGKKKKAVRIPPKARAKSNKPHGKQKKRVSPKSHRPPLVPGAATSAADLEQDRPLNARQEKFCREYVRGKTATEAYAEAYGQSGEGAEASASRLLSNVRVAARVKALQTEAAAGSVLSLRGTLEYLYRVVATPIGLVDEMSDLCQEYVRKEEGGARGRLKRGKADRGNEDHEDEYEVIKIKMPDKLRALELNAKLTGLLRDEVKLEAGDSLAELLKSIRSGA